MTNLQKYTSSNSTLFKSVNQSKVEPSKAPSRIDVSQRISKISQKQFSYEPEKKEMEFPNFQKSISEQV